MLVAFCAKPPIARQDQQGVMELPMRMRSDLPVVQLTARCDGFDVQKVFVDILQGLAVQEVLGNQAALRHGP